MEFSLRPLGFMEFLQNNNHLAVNKMKRNESKNTVENSWDFEGNFTCDCVCVCVCVCVCMYVCMCLCGL